VDKYHPIVIILASFESIFILVAGSKERFWMNIPREKAGGGF